MALALILSGCGDDTPPGRHGTAPYRISGPACLHAVAARGIAAQLWSGGAGRGCAVDTPVRAAAGATAGLAPPLETSCAMLLAWSDFEDAVQAAAVTHLGRRVRAVRHYGSFACRRMTGNAGRPSLHAQARALDVAGFELADGRTVSVAEGWSGPRAQRRFLRAVARAACRHFSVTLTPDSDRFHQDHLHVDIGPWRACDL